MEYLKNPVRHVFRPEPEVFGGHATLQVVSCVDVREPAVTVKGSDRQRPLLQVH